MPKSVKRTQEVRGLVKAIITIRRVRSELAGTVLIRASVGQSCVYR